MGTYKNYRKPKVDWSRLLSDLSGRGLTMVDISVETGIPRSTINSIRAGSEPSHSAGEALLNFWRERIIASVLRSDALS
jgi:lambda repressor-like predicted transcriptional regulator